MEIRDIYSTFMDDLQESNRLLLLNCVSEEEKEFIHNQQTNSEQIDVQFLLPKTTFKLTKSPTSGLHRISYTIDNPDLLGTVGSTITTNNQFETKIIDNITHDFTFGCLASVTDCKLKEYFPLKRDGSDNWTPDLIITEHNRTHTSVIEFTTVYSTNQQKLREAFHIKSLKYLQALRNRTTPDRSIFYYIIVVGIDKILHNLINLSRNVVAELIIRYRFSENIRSYLVDIECIQSKTKEELTLAEKKNKIYPINHGIPF
ncbi:MAG: RNA-dependent RNA polymerase [Hangzhou phenuivirus 2]|nr:MAG: RNA-dependent RNA polymerase [Hangzhou phenuivirus 2]